MLILLAIMLTRVPTIPVQLNQATDSARPCPSDWNKSSSDPKKKRPKQAGNQPEASAACIELPFSTLEIQEYLQSYSRSQRWAVSEERITEDTWTFSLAINVDELVKNTKREARPESVAWRSGIALFKITSVPASDGFTRSIVSADFRGYGEGPDRFAPQKEYWELESNGSFEASIVSALKNHFQRNP